MSASDGPVASVWESRRCAGGMFGCAWAQRGTDATTRKHFGSLLAAESYANAKNLEEWEAGPFIAYPLDESRDSIDVAEEWVAAALRGGPWETRDSNQQEPCFVERGTTRDGNAQRFLAAPLSYLDACIIERLLEVARGESD